jgi:hypothetical protein
MKGWKPPTSRGCFGLHQIVSWLLLALLYHPLKLSSSGSISLLDETVSSESLSEVSCVQYLLVLQICAILSICPTRIDYTPMRVILYTTHSTSITRFDSSLSVKVVNPPITNTCNNFSSLSHVPSSIILAGRCVQNF